MYNVTKFLIHIQYVYVYMYTHVYMSICMYYTYTYLHVYITWYYMILYMYISTDVEAFDVLILGTILPSVLKGIKVKNEVCVYITITSSSS